MEDHRDSFDIVVGVFVGSGKVLLNIPNEWRKIKVYNDLDDDLYITFKVLQGPKKDWHSQENLDWHLPMRRHLWSCGIQSTSRMLTLLSSLFTFKPILSWGREIVRQVVQGKHTYVKIHYRGFCIREGMGHREHGFQGTDEEVFQTQGIVLSGSTVPVIRKEIQAQFHLR